MTSTIAGIDSSLAVLIVLTALGAGAVTFAIRRRTVDAAAVTLGTVAAFAIMIGLAYASVIATVAFVGLATGAVSFLMLRADLGRRLAVAAAIGIGLFMSAAFVVVFHLAVMAFAAAMALYALVRTRVRLAPALIVTGTTLSGLLAGAAMVFWIGLQNM